VVRAEISTKVKHVTLEENTHDTYGQNEQRYPLFSKKKVGCAYVSAENFLNLSHLRKVKL
jgi:hypothetical protein